MPPPQRGTAISNVVSISHRPTRRDKTVSSRLVPSRHVGANPVMKRPDREEGRRIGSRSRLKVKLRQLVAEVGGGGGGEEVAGRRDGDGRGRVVEVGRRRRRRPGRQVERGEGRVRQAARRPRRPSSAHRRPSDGQLQHVRRAGGPRPRRRRPVRVVVARGFPRPGLGGRVRRRQSARLAPPPSRSSRLLLLLLLGNALLQLRCAFQQVCMCSASSTRHCCRSRSGMVGGPRAVVRPICFRFRFRWFPSCGGRNMSYHISIAKGHCLVQEPVPYQPIAPHLLLSAVLRRRCCWLSVLNTSSAH